MPNPIKALTLPTSPRISYGILARMARRLSRLRDYYCGWSTPGLWDARLATNVLVFSKTDPRHWQPIRRRPKDCHHRHVLILPLLGRCRVEIDAEQFDLEPGFGLLVRPFQVHDYVVVPQTEPLCWLFVTFDISSECLAGLAGPRPVSADALPQLRSLIQWGMAKGTSPVLQQAGPFALMQLLAHLAAQPAVEQRVPMKADERWLHACLVDMQSGRSRNQTCATVAKRAGVSESFLRLTFRRRFGRSLGRHLRELRIRRAMSLIASSDLKITEIAERLGYSSIHSFCRAFRNEMGCPPSAFARHVRPPVPGETV